MKRSGPLARRTPLSTVAPLVRRTPLRAVSPKRAAATQPKRSSGHRIPVDVSAIVAERSGGRCEIGLPLCTLWATQKHHRITQKAGGRHGAAAARSDRPSNLLHVCSRCHDTVTEAPEWAKKFEHGWALNERDEPTQRPVLYRRRLVFLDDAGGVHDYEAHCA